MKRMSLATGAGSGSIHLSDLLFAQVDPAFYGPDGNIHLLRDCGSETMSADDASEVILRSLKCRLGIGQAP